MVLEGVCAVIDNGDGGEGGVIRPVVTVALVLVSTSARFKTSSCEGSCSCTPLVSLIGTGVVL